MELGKRYSVAYKGLKNSAYDFRFEVDGDLFAAYESKEIKDGRCEVGVTMRKESDTQLLFDVAIEGYAVCECDRCLEDCKVPIGSRIGRGGRVRRRYDVGRALGGGDRPHAIYL